MDSEQGRGLVALHVRDPVTGAIVPMVVQAGTNRQEVVTFGGGPVPAGTVIDERAPVAVGIGATVVLAAPPAGTLAINVQNVSVGAAVLAFRQVGAAAGVGKRLPRFGIFSWNLAVAALEVEHISGPAGLANIGFEVT